MYSNKKDNSSNIGSSNGNSSNGNSNIGNIGSSNGNGTIGNSNIGNIGSSNGNGNIGNGNIGNGNIGGNIGHSNGNSNFSTYNVRILRSSYGEIERAIRQCQIESAEGCRSGSGQGRLWKLASGQKSVQAALSDQTFALGGIRLEANVYQMPGEAFNALVAGSRGQFRRDPDISQLLSLVGMGTGAAVGTTVQTPTLPICIWQPSETRLIQKGYDWLLSLCFKTVGNWTLQGQRAGAGVDVGLRPLATAVIGGRFFVTQGPNENQARQISEFEPETAEVVEYIWARQALDLLTAELVRGAEYVAVEALILDRLQGTSSFQHFISRARTAAVLDWHQAWLPQKLYAAGIPLFRVRLRILTLSGQQL